MSIINHNNKITIIVPIHNKERYIESTIKSIQEQDYQNYNLILLMDNCTDNTEDIILNSPILETISNYNIVYSRDNKYKKSGALNQLFKYYNNIIEDYVMILDADTVIERDTISTGLTKLLSDKRLGAVCSKAGVSHVKSVNLWQKLVWGLQHVEYAQFDSHRIETEGKIKVVHGMCAIFKKKALNEITIMRYLHYDLEDNIYLEDNLVEDYELSISLKELGWSVTACMEMKAYTEVPLSIRELYVQRLRWLRGGVDTLRLHGWNRTTLPDRLNNVLFIIINIMKLIVLISLIIYVLNDGIYVPNELVILVFTVLYVDSIYRMKYIDNLCMTDVVIKLLIIPEMLYFWFQAYIMAMSLIYSYLGIEQKW